MNLYVVFDRIARESSPVNEAKNDGVAWRMFKNMMKEKEAQGVNPAEYQLLHVGVIDHETNKIEPFVPSEVTQISVEADMFREDEKNGKAL